MRAFLVAIMYGMTYGMECSDLRTVFQQSSCCGGEGDTCLRAIPDCADVSNGAVCFNGQTVEVKGLSDYLGFEANHLELRKHIIPSQNAAFDLGNAEYKIRHLFLSDN